MILVTSTLDIPFEVHSFLVWMASSPFFFLLFIECCHQQMLFSVGSHGFFIDYFYFSYIAILDKWDKVVAVVMVTMINSFVDTLFCISFMLDLFG